MSETLYVSILIRQTTSFSAMHELIAEVSRRLEQAGMEFDMKLRSGLKSRAIHQGNDTSSALDSFDGYEIWFCRATATEDMRRFASLMNELLLLPGLGGIEVFVSEEVIHPGEVTSLPIEELGLGNRAYNRISRQGIKTVGELIGKTYADIRKIPGMGSVSTDEVVETLAARGLSLRKP